MRCCPHASHCSTWPPYGVTGDRVRGVRAWKELVCRPVHEPPLALWRGGVGLIRGLPFTSGGP